MDLMGAPNVVRAVVEAARLSYGHLYHPTFATETALIDPLPHQRLAVYEHLLPQSRLRFLLADDAGAGKTIMTGLYIREQLNRRLIQRVLIIPPAGLVGNWEHELRTLFGLSFRILAGSAFARANPFIGEDGRFVIVSLDTLAGGRPFQRLGEQGVEPYDLVVFDEAHKLAADREPDLTLRRTDRYKLAEALAGVPTDHADWQLPWRAHHLLLLTATPHMGKDYPYYCLWRLLEPEALSTFEAFQRFPLEARKRHFLRRTKEEMVRYDGAPIYPPRQSVTLEFRLHPGERQLYDETTRYIETYYNRASTLNRSAARLAMSVFQRRLVSSTFALLRSLERRRDVLERKLAEAQRQGIVVLGKDEPQIDYFEAEAGDDEETIDGREAHEIFEDQAINAVVSRTVEDLTAERDQVAVLVDLAQRVEAQKDESKFRELQGVLDNPNYMGEKLLIFTEHRDTLLWLVERLEGLGYAGQITRIHGGLDYREREAQVAHFRQPLDNGGARFLVATDAAGEGINLQFCWLMVNYDLPWNPARLEQRLGRIHRYGQQRDRVVITNLIAEKTREGNVMKTLLLKLETMRGELQSDKVFDVIGPLFQQVSLSSYMDRMLRGEPEEFVIRDLQGQLTIEQIQAREAREQALYGREASVATRLPELRVALERETYQRLVPGYVRHFIELVAPLLEMRVEGDLNGLFRLVKEDIAETPDCLRRVMERFSLAEGRLSLSRPANRDTVLFVHPGEPVFDVLALELHRRYGDQALRGAIFVDAQANAPYVLHVAEVRVVRQAEPSLPPLARSEPVATRMVALREDPGSVITPISPAVLLTLADHTGSALPPGVSGLGRLDLTSQAAISAAISQVAAPLALERAAELRATIAERQHDVQIAFNFEEADLAERRQKLKPQVDAGDLLARSAVTKIRDLQRALQSRRQRALDVIAREPELIMPGSVTILARVLVIPAQDPADGVRQAAATESIAMQVVVAYEEVRGATVHDVSTPNKARAAGLEDWPGFDLLVRRPDGTERAIEVKGRAGTGEVEMKENEYAKAVTLREQYWLYVVYDCASMPRTPLRVRDPFGQLLARTNGVRFGQGDIIDVAEQD